MKLVDWCDLQSMVAYKVLPKRHTEKAIECLKEEIVSNNYFICADTYVRFALPVFEEKDSKYVLLTSLKDWSELFGSSDLLLSKTCTVPEKLPEKVSKCIRRFNAVSAY